MGDSGGLNYNVLSRIPFPFFVNNVTTSYDTGDLGDLIYSLNKSFQVAQAGRYGGLGDIYGIEVYLCE